MPTARSVKLDSARSLAAADPTGTLVHFVPRKEIIRILEELAYDFRKRLYTPFVTVCMMVLQALNQDGSQRKAVAATMTARRAKGCTTGSSDPSAYCSARQRLRLGLLLRLVDAVAAWLQKAARSRFWHERRVLLLDGTTASMPDTPDNQAFFGQPSGQKPGCGFPVARLCALFCLASGALVEAMIGPLVQSELSLWRAMLHLLRKGDIVVADRYFSSFADLAMLAMRGVDAVVRLNQNRLFRRFGKRDYIAVWRRPKVRPPWMSDEAFQALPDVLRVRIIRYRVTKSGRRTGRIVLATTLLDSTLYPAEELAALYGRRWEIEVDFDHLKTTLGMDVLSAESPEVVIKEVWAHFLAYNLLRALMWEAGERCGVDPLRLSLKGVVQQMLAHRLHVGVFKPRTVVMLIVAVIQSNKIPDRPDRCEPRAKKRRPKEYDLMNEPRDVLRSRLLCEA
ncbi:MAG TPA: IS4 family transposase [Planctomycetota bacterium]|nr:IS4 family transposase [Planctomycetota bacterium]